MHKYRLSLMVCVWRLESGTVIAECPTFPELSCAGDTARSVVERLKRGIVRIARGLPRGELFRRQLTAISEQETLTVLVEPPVRTAAWDAPVELNLETVVWSPAADYWILWVPLVGIQVLGRTATEVRELAPAHIKAALARSEATWAPSVRGHSLPRLAELQRSVSLRQVRIRVSVPVRTPKQAAQQEELDSAPRKSVLKETTVRVATESISPVLGREHEVAHVASVLTGRSPRSVLLVGPSGAGKTAVFHEVVRRRADFGLEQKEFRETSGARLVAGMTGFGMWQERCQALCRETEKADVILHLGPLIELLDVGKCEGNALGIASFLRPAIVRGAVLAVAECTPEQLSLVERLNPQLVLAFEVIRIAESDGPTTARILRQCAADSPRPVVRDPQGHETTLELIGSEALETLQRLHRRYATYSAFPGRPLRFLRNLLRDRFDSIQLRATLGPTESGPLSDSDVIAAFAQETGLPRALLDDRVPLDPTRLVEQVRRRVVGQEAAVDCVVNLLCTIKSGLARTGRPLASLLFIGPTGVGKTELAKTLAEILFGDEGRLTRFDMSEFGDPVSALRLIGGAVGDEGVLTSRVREQPFSVILLDEFEKADASVFDLMLQVLGEGRLTDGGGRLADFSNAVIVMTSNLGAEAAQQGAAGFIRERGSISNHFEQAVRQFFRPELFNRFDAIVAFEALGEAELRRIARLQLDQIRSRDGILYRDRGWTVEDSVLDGLVRRGFDPRYGARPLKRVLERELLAPLAAQLNALPADAPVMTSIESTGSSLSVQVRSLALRGQGALPALVADPSVNAVTELRRQTRTMIDASPVQVLRNELYRLETELERERRRMLKWTALGKSWRPAQDSAQRMSRAAALRALIQDLTALGTTVDALEDQVLLKILMENRVPEIDGAAIHAARAEWWRLAEELYLERFPTTDRLVLALFSESAETLAWLAREYGRMLESECDEIVLWEFTSVQRGTASKRVAYENPAVDPVWHQPVVQTKTVLDQLPESVVGVAWACRGRGCFPRLQSESGIHVVTSGKNDALCLVCTEAVRGVDYRPPPGVAPRRHRTPRPERSTPLFRGNECLEGRRRAGENLACLGTGHALAPGHPRGV